MQVTGNLADALNWSSEAAVMFADYMSEDVTTAEDAFNEALKECNTEAERQALITDTLTKLYGGAAEEYENTAASVMEANRQTADYALTQAELAEKIEPVTTAVKGGFNAILASVLELAGNGSLDGFAKDIEGAFKSFIDEMLPKIVDGFQWIIDHKDGLIAGILGIASAFLAFKIVTIIQSVTTAMQGMTAAQWLLNAAMNANPIGLIIAAISALVAAFIYLWNNCEPFKQFWLDLWDSIKNAAKAVADWFSETWSAVSEWFISAWQSVSDFFVGLWTGIKDTAQAVADWFISAWQAVSDFFIGLWTSIKDFAISAWNGIVEVFTTIATWFDENVIQPIWNFIYPFVHNAKVLITGTWEIIQALFAIAAEWFDENVFQPISKFFTDLCNFVKKTATAVWDWIVGVFTVAATWFNDNVIQPIVTFFVGLWTDIKKGASDAWLKIKEIFQVVSSWFDTNVIQPVSKFFTGMWDGLKKGASDAWTGVKKAFSSVSTWFKDTFSQAWQKVKEVFSTGGKVFDGIKDGIVSTFKTVVNAIIRGINKVVAVPFNAINSVLSKIKNVEIAKIKPFSGLISNISVPSIPELEYGGILKKGQVGLLEGKGSEAIIPLERNLEWIRNIANELSKMLGLEDIKRQLQAEGVIAGVASAVGGSAPLRGNTIINAGMTVNYNGNLSRKELKRLENDNYTALKTRLKTEGAI